MDETQFLNIANMIAEKNGMWVNWETSDIENNCLDFGGGTDDQIADFIDEMEQVLGGEIA